MAAARVVAGSRSAGDEGQRGPAQGGQIAGFHPAPSVDSDRQSRPFQARPPHARPAPAPARVEGIGGRRHPADDPLTPAAIIRQARGTVKWDPGAARQDRGGRAGGGSAGLRPLPGIGGRGATHQRQVRRAMSTSPNRPRSHPVLAGKAPQQAEESGLPNLFGCSQGESADFDVALGRCVAPQGGRCNAPTAGA
jgi:hypothetical protein